MNNDLNSKRFKRLRIAFWGHWIGLFLMFLLMKIGPELQNEDAIFWLSNLSVFGAFSYIACCLVYVITLAQLVVQINKSVVLWLVGTIFTTWIGILISYIRMKSYAIQNDWCK